MKDEFLSKLNSKKYISKVLFNTIKENYSFIIPLNFDIDKYNEDVLNSEYTKYKEYFDNLYKDVDSNIHLDEDQIKAVLSDENYTLVIAGAGTGKTTTVVAKVKYLVDIKKIDPSKILVMSYTKKATEELEKRLVVDFNLPIDIETFHSLGYKIVRNIYKSHFPYVIDLNARNEIFLNYFKNVIFIDKNKTKDLIFLFDEIECNNQKWLLTSYFKENYDKFKTFDEYFDNYKLKKINEALEEGIENKINRILEKDSNSEFIHTIKNELVKSKGEAIIANFLFCNGIDYYYEKVYEEILPNYKVYKPDFTLNIGGEEVYIEYFGLSNYNDDELKTYQKIKEMKEEYHYRHHNKFIKIDYMPNEDIVKTLELSLLKLGFKLKRKSNTEIYNAILDRNKLAELYNIKNIFYETIDTIKSSLYRDNVNSVVKDYISAFKDEEKNIKYRQYCYIVDFYKYYQKELFDKNNYGFDYGDMIYYAKKSLRNLDKDFLQYDYIIIDEYQDISSLRYDLTTEVINKSNSKLMVVGDDWQTIYSFSGSKIEYIYNFSKYYPNSKMFSINKTYRNSQKLVDYAGKFIMKNSDQIKKKLTSDKLIDKPIVFVPFDNYFEIEELKKLIMHLYSNNKDNSILILSRFNKNINNLFNDTFFKEDVGNKIKISTLNDAKIEGMSIHKSKGLTRDEVIIIGLDTNFPMRDRGEFWLKYLFMNHKIEESIKDAEERRVFYVALTRTKNHVYLLTNRESKYRSAFINELYDIIKNYV